MHDAASIEDLVDAPAREVPSLEDLCFDAVAANVHIYEPTSLAGALPFGGGATIVERLVATRRLRPETLGPLLVDRDDSSFDAVSQQLGSALASSAAGCRGLAMLASHRLLHTTRGGDHTALPAGTRRPGSAAAWSAAR